MATPSSGQGEGPAGDAEEPVELAGPPSDLPSPLTPQEGGEGVDSNAGAVERGPSADPSPASAEASGASVVDNAPQSPAAEQGGQGEAKSPRPVPKRFLRKPEHSCGDEERREANRAIRAARDELFTTAAKLNAVEKLTDAEDQEIKQKLKLGDRGPHRRTPSVVALHLAADVVRQHTRLLKSRLEALLPEDGPAVVEEVPAPAEAKKRSGRRGMTLSEVPAFVGGKVEAPPTSETCRDVSILEVAADQERWTQMHLRQRVVHLMEQGLSARDALTQCGVIVSPASLRRAQRWRKLATERGGKLQDRRWGRRPEKRVLTTATQAAILQLYNGRPGLNAVHIHQHLEEHWESYKATRPFGEGLSEHPPSYSSVQQFIKALPASIRLARSGRLETWRKEHHPIVPVLRAQYANEVWQIDHAQPHIHVRVYDPVAKEWHCAAAHMTLVIDEFSGVALAFRLSLAAPNLATVFEVMRLALTRPSADGGQWPRVGRPKTLLTDRAQEFTTPRLKETLEMLGITVEHARKHTPNDKSEIEKVFEDVNARLALYPGHHLGGKSEGSGEKKVGVLLTLSQLEVEMRRVLRGHNTDQRGKGRASPMDVWFDTAQGEPVELEKLKLLSSRSGPRKVTRSRVNFIHEGGGGDYYAFKLQDLEGRMVYLHYYPENLEEVTVCLQGTGEVVCRAMLLSAERGPTPEQILSDRKLYEAAIVARTRRYFQWLERLDREAAKEYGAPHAEKIAAIYAEDVEKQVVPPARRKEEGEGICSLVPFALPPSAPGTSTSPASGTSPVSAQPSNGHGHLGPSTPGGALTPNASGPATHEGGLSSLVPYAMPPEDPGPPADGNAGATQGPASGPESPDSVASGATAPGENRPGIATPEGGEERREGGLATPADGLPRV